MDILCICSERKWITLNHWSSLCIWRAAPDLRSRSEEGPKYPAKCKRVLPKTSALHLMISFRPLTRFMSRKTSFLRLRIACANMPLLFLSMAHKRSGVVFLISSMNSMIPSFAACNIASYAEASRSCDSLYSEILWHKQFSISRTRRWVFFCSYISLIPVRIKH